MFKIIDRPNARTFQCGDAWGVDMLWPSPQSAITEAIEFVRKNKGQEAAAALAEAIANG